MFRKETKCWSCKMACNKCSWSKDFEPVEGWIAKKTKHRNSNGIIESYFVKECPEYEYDGLCLRCLNYDKDIKIDKIENYHLICPKKKINEHMCDNYQNKNLICEIEMSDI